MDLKVEKRWLDPPKASFTERASLEIARWVLVIFAVVYGICFFIAVMSFYQGAKAQDLLEMMKYLLGSILPVVTLAVGYYLGDRRGGNDSEE